MIFFTSDFHFGHDREFLWQPRGFANYEEHAQIIINNYNQIIHDDDTVYILGDCMLKNDDFGIECLKQLKGHKYLALGNHDTENRIIKYEEANIFEDIQYGYRLRYGKYSFWAQHYPAMMGNYKKEKPTFCLCGHTHSPDKWQNIAHGCYNVAVDAHHCYPIEIEIILKEIKEYRKNHADKFIDYLDKTPYCASCYNRYTCLAKENHSLECPGFVAEERVK